MSAGRGEHALFGETIEGAATRLTEHTVAELGSLIAVRERHLEATVKEALQELTGKVPISRVLPAPGWPSLGRSPVDVVLFEDNGTARPQHLLELKWCQDRHDKVYEAIWDLFKLACLSRLDGIETSHLVTGAPVELWETAFCGDLFEGGRFRPEDLCERVLPWGKDPWVAWDDLLYGGHDRAPDSVPGPIETVPAERVRLNHSGLEWEIRAVSVHPGTEGVPFRGGWPHGRRPADARRPAEVVPEADSSLATASESAEERPIFLGPRFDEAVVLARTLHFGHARKGTSIVYLSHLLAVAALVLEDGGDEDEAIAALLHDAVEDQGGERRLDQIRHLFGDRVAEVVEGCSDTQGEPKPPWRERKERYLEHLRSAPRTDVLRVSLADKVHNARTILQDLRDNGDELWSRFTTESADDQLWYYGELARNYEHRFPGRLAEELRRTVDELERLARPAHA